MNKSAKTRQNIRALAESAIFTALAFLLSYIRIYKLPQGGSLTLASMLPIIIVGIRWGAGWGLGSGAVYAMLQLFQDGGVAPPTSTIFNYFLVFMLDYFIAFTVLGASAFFRRLKYGVVISVPVCLFLRFLCHFTSGIIIWGVYAPEGTLPAVYSLVYNGSFMGLELLLTLVLTAVLYKTLPEKYFSPVT
jgi:thiamine transporter